MGAIIIPQHDGSTKKTQIDQIEDKGSHLQNQSCTGVITGGGVQLSEAARNQWIRWEMYDSFYKLPAITVQQKHKQSTEKGNQKRS
eukprot:512406-Prorocentrum_minimum.AAC.1